MKSGVLKLIVASALVLQPCAALAADPAVAAKPSGPSAFVRCDGNPNKPSTLGTVARLIAITAIVGLLIPQRETGDPKLRESGAAGIKACDDALSGSEPAKDGGRRLELIFGRAIHRMEAGDWDGAIADLRSAPTDQPELTSLVQYRQSLGLTASNLEAMALVGKGDYAGAQALALRMADQAPYDLINMVRIIDYMRLIEGFGPDEERYFNGFVKIYPMGLKDRAEQLSGVRRFAEAAADYRSLSAMGRSIPKWDEGQYFWDARAAVAFRLAGNKAEGDRLIAAAKAEAEAATASGRSGEAAAIADTSNSVDLYTILVALDEGQTARARTLFSARSGWGNLPVGMVAELARRLEPVGTPAERAATPIPTAAELFDRAHKRVVAVINDPGKDNGDRFRTYRPAFGANDFSRFARNVWRTDKSRYLAEKPNADLDATYVTVTRDGDGVPAGYAMLLHLALMAKARGDDGFMMLPGQRALFGTFTRIGKRNDPRMVPAVMYETDTVIADLRSFIPPPPPSK